MTKDKHKTYVRFVYLKGELLAVFMRGDANRTFNGYGFIRDCYAHTGQHGTCYDGASKLKRATPKQFAPLKNEMEGLGYNLVVMP